MVLSTMQQQQQQRRMGQLEETPVDAAESFTDVGGILTNQHLSRAAGNQQRLNNRLQWPECERKLFVSSLFASLTSHHLSSWHAPYLHLTYCVSIHLTVVGRNNVSVCTSHKNGNFPNLQSGLQLSPLFQFCHCMNLQSVIF